MARAYSFNEQLKIGKEGEEFLDEFFAKNFHIYDPDMQTWGIDRIWTGRKSRDRWSVEYKTDNRAAKTGNFFIEIISVDETKTPGWAKTSIAQLLVYYVPSLQKIWIAQVGKIRFQLNEWLKNMSVGKSPNVDTKTGKHTYNTVGILVPITEFEKLCNKILEL